MTCGGREVLSLVKPDGTTTVIDPAKVNDIPLQPEEAFLRWSATDRDVDLLFWSQKSEKDEPTLKGTYYVARFDPEGTYHGSTLLSLGVYKPQTFAAFPNGDLAIVGLDETNQQLELLHYAMIGGKVSVFLADKAMAKDNAALGFDVAAEGGLSNDELASMRLDSSSQMDDLVPYKDAVLLLQPNSSAPIFEMFANGTVKTIPVPKLQGFEATRILPSDDGIFLEYSRLTEGGSYTPLFVVEMDASGTPLRKMAMNRLEAVCETGGKFRTLTSSAVRTLRGDAVARAE